MTCSEQRLEELESQNVARMKEIGGGQGQGEGGPRRDAVDPAESKADRVF